MGERELTSKALTAIFKNTQMTQDQKKKWIDNVIDLSNPTSIICPAFPCILNFMIKNDNSLWSIPLYANAAFVKKFPNDMITYLKNENFITLLETVELSRLSITLIWLNESLSYLVECMGEKLPLTHISNILFEKMVENRKHSNIISQIATILILCPGLIPNGQKVFKISNTIIYLVADFPTPTTIQTQKHMVEIGNLLGILWNKMSLDDLKLTLAILYKIISNPDTSSQVCPAMAHILSLVSENVVTTLAPRLVTSEPINSLQFTATLTRLSNWLFSWPLASDTMNFWIKTLVQILCQSGKYTIPKNTAMQQISKLIEALRIPVCRFGAFEGITTFLMSYQLSPDIFVQMIPQLIKIITILKLEDTAESSETLLRINELCQAQIIVHGIEHEAYQSLRDHLKDIPVPLEEDVRKLIEMYHWASTYPANTEYSSAAVEPFELKSRGISQKIGLGNLGNTCYMNSIIQALFMTDSFRTSVIQSNMKPTQLILTNIRQLFALLCFSNRNFILPVFFYNASTPPWFQSGMQHDCSEYLRYLLTALFEEEKLSSLPQDSSEPMNTNNSETASLASDLPLLPEFPEFESLILPPFANQDAEMGRSCASPSSQKSTPEYVQSDCKMDFESSNKSDLPMENGTFDPAMEYSGSSKSDMLCHPDSGDCIMDFETSIDSLGSGKRKKLAPDVFDSPNGKVLKGDIQTCTESDSASDSGISGDLTEEKDYAITVEVVNIQTDQQQIPNDDFATLVHKVFGGIISTTIKCLNCKTDSVHQDVFTDINLAFQDRDHTGSPLTRNVDDDRSKEDLTIEQMISNYFSPEILSGDNQYECDRCNCKQDAKKSVQIIEAPDHLILTQLRFYYDIARSQRQKVFTKVNFTEDLLLPLYQSETPYYKTNDNDNSPMSENNFTKTSESKSNSNHKETLQTEAYTLYAVVVHSGVSSEGGHYYCFARSSSLASITPQERERCGDLGVWNNFNDEDVTQTNFENISRLASTFTRDTAYVLFYQKVGDLKYSNAANSIEDKSSLHSDIKDIIETDNRIFQAELEQAQRKLKANTPKKNHHQDPPPPPGNCGGGGLDFSPPVIY